MNDRKELDNKTIDELLQRLNDIAVSDDPYEFGLPVYEHAHSLDTLRSAVIDWLRVNNLIREK